MTPITLEMAAFGPFRQPQRLDFSLLKGSGLFLITGKTGAGKTTIFDAISFALFGEPGSKTRRSQDLKSDFSGPEERCSVTFTFAVRGKSYVVTRTPKQRTLNRAGEETERQATAKLLDTATGEEWSGAGSVSGEIERLLGMNQEQFRKIVLLPQGEFRSFLDATSKEKQEIFRKIFNTELYEAFRKYLTRERSRLKEERDQYYANLAGALNSHKAALGDEELSEMADGVLYPASVEERLEALAKELAARQDSLSAEKRDLDQKREELRLEQAKEVNRKLDQLDETRREAALLSKRDGEMGKIDAFIRRSGHVRLLSRHQDEEEKASRELDALQNQLADAGSREAPLAQRQADAQAALEAALKAQEAKPGLEKAAEELTRVAEQYRGLAKAQEEIKLHQEAVEKKKEQAEKISLLSSRLEKKRLADQDAACVRELAAFQTLWEAASQATESYLDAKDAYFSAYSRFLDGQAGILAAQLQENQPCPVCGSTLHPAKATLPEKTPSQAEVDQLQSRMNAAQESSAKALSRARQGWQKAAGALESLGDALPPYEVLDGQALASVQEAWRLRAGQSASALARAEKELAARLEARFRNDPKFADPENLERHARRLGEELAAEQGRLQTIRENAASIRREIPAAYPSPEAVEEEKAAVQRRIQDLDAALKAAEKNTADLRRERELLSQSIASLKEQASKAEGRKESARQEFQALFSQLSYAGSEQYQADLALLEEEEALREALADFHKKRDGTAALLKRLEQETAGLARQPLEDLLKMDQELERQSKGVQDELQKAAVRTAEAEHLLASWKETRKALSAKEEELQTVKNLADAADGSNLQHIDFERYVMTGFFEQIVDSANLRLQTMSNGRYSIARKLERADNGRASGLDLLVLDANTGKQRETSTLSGGESFLTALSLALAVAEVITRYSGGVEINTMLIDEGFGSLDAESLETAMDALQSLRAGNRLIGIISHVEALAHYIPAKLAVTATPQGSFAKFLC